MRKVIIAGAVLATLWVAPAGSAHHVVSDFPHFSTKSDLYNGGSCGAGKGWIHLVDRTGLGTGWRNTYFPSVISRLSPALNGRFCFSWEFKSRWELAYLDPPDQPQPCPGPCQISYRLDEAFAQLGPGDILVVPDTSSTFGSRCSEPRYGMVEPYCQGQGNHRVACVVGNGGGGGQDASDTLLHELGHCVGGLGHQLLVEKPGGGFMCVGPTGAQTFSVMCALNYSQFDAHDKTEMRRVEMYGHGH